MIKSIYTIKPRYGEVDQMGYVYHANYVSYCHQARTELMREYGLHDAYLENLNLMLPVISFDIKYKKPTHYDETIVIETTINELPRVRFYFDFKIYNEEQELLSEARSAVVFVDSDTRLPKPIPDFVLQTLEQHFTSVEA